MGGQSKAWTSFNPLHCGAVVASRAVFRCARAPRVSIPFIAGQWSLQKVIAPRRMAEGQVSIPFIAGQWSLLDEPPGWRLVVHDVSIPFIAGQWSLHDAGGRRAGPHPAVSIPFIAGQWSLLPRRLAPRFREVGFQSPSLRGSGRFREELASAADEAASFNPLHCGAVVASLPRDTRHRVCRVRFNPLHCGAVVASGSKLRLVPRQKRAFQSPSLRGSGRFEAEARAQQEAQALVSICFNPLHCGAVVASGLHVEVRPPLI